MNFGYVTERAGRILFVIGLAGLGLLSLIYRDFALVWQPVPDNFPMRSFSGALSGAILVLSACGLAVPRTAKISGYVLAVFVSSWLLLLQAPKVLGAPSNAGVWLGFGENLLLVCGAWIIALRQQSRREGPLNAASSSSNSSKASDSSDPANSIRVFQLLYGLSLPMIGISHFVYRDATAGMVPAWLPWRMGFAVLTGAGHIAAGIAILISVFPALAAVLEAGMIGAFVLLLHLPGVVAEPSSRMQWTMLAIATAYCGSAWSVASSLIARKGSG
ncbi:MAG TPA: hypothetical protein VFT72_04445 [Opitutaceae bacterium]|nr:hypothetical protein [Opitutaceae bacterium]